MSRDPAWRDDAAARLAAGEIARGAQLGSVLIVGDPRDDVAEVVRRKGGDALRWDRMALPDREASPWPVDGPFDLIAIRLTKSKPALDLIFDAVLPRLAPEGRVLLYGARDEGIRSATRRIETATGPWTTRATGGHSRLLEWVRPADFEGFGPPAASPDHLARTLQLDVGDGPGAWTTWPGVFGSEGIDDGSALLLENLPEAVGPIVDFGAGTGVLAGGLVAAGADPAELVLIEPDALAARAATLNVPGAEVRVQAGWRSMEGVGTVIANPPWHEGKAESVAIIEELVRGAARDLRKGGELRLVVQRRLPLDGMLSSCFGSVQVIADRAAYRVWSARRS